MPTDEYIEMMARKCKAAMFWHFPKGVSHEIQKDIIKKLRGMLDEELEIRTRVVRDA